MPNFRGIWSADQQFQARKQGIWPSVPIAPTIGSATAGNNVCASVNFTPSTSKCYAGGVTAYTVTSTPGCVSVSGASSPIVVGGLTLGTSYTFKVKATNAIGDSLCSSASNSITAKVPTCASYTCAGTYSWVAPSCVTSIAVVTVGGGGGTGGADPCGPGGASAGAGGGALAYANSISVTPGNSYCVVVGSGGSSGAQYSSGTSGGSSWLSTGATYHARAGGGQYSGAGYGCCRNGGTVTNGTGGAGGKGGASKYTGSGTGGGGAGGYSGAGGNGAKVQCNIVYYATDGSGGGGGGGGHGSGSVRGGGGGGVGLFGQGCNGAAPTTCNPYQGQGGSGGTPTSTTTASPSGGLYGGGAGGSSGVGSGSSGQKGAVRIVWCIAGVRGTPAFPSTNVGA